MCIIIVHKTPGDHRCFIFAIFLSRHSGMNFLFALTLHRLHEDHIGVLGGAEWHTTNDDNFVTLADEIGIE